MKVLPGSAAHIGARTDQQDAFGFSDIEDAAFVAHGGVLAVVADGMGGLEHGAKASQLAVQTLLDVYMRKAPQEPVEDALGRALKEANTAVYRLAQHSEGEGRVGTTLAAVVVQGDVLHWVAVGDTRIYLYRNGQLHHLNADHVYARDLVRQVAAGQLTRAEADAHVEHDALTSFLGLETLPEVDCNLKPFPLRVGDRLLLCSDGLYGSLSEEALCVPLGEDPMVAAARLKQAVLAQAIAHQDNLTAVILALTAAKPGSTAASASPQGKGLRARRQSFWLWMGLVVGLAVLLTVGALWQFPNLRAAWDPFASMQSQPPVKAEPPKRPAPAPAGASESGLPTAPGSETPTEPSPEEAKRAPVSASKGADQDAAKTGVRGEPPGEPGSTEEAPSASPAAGSP